MSPREKRMNLLLSPFWHNCGQSHEHTVITYLIHVQSGLKWLYTKASRPLYNVVYRPYIALYLRSMSVWLVIVCSRWYRGLTVLGVVMMLGLAARWAGLVMVMYDMARWRWYGDVPAAVTSSIQATVPSHGTLGIGIDARTLRSSGQGYHVDTA